MRVIGVIDLRLGRAVHAQGGNRERYVPIAALGATSVGGDAVTLARAYIDTVGLHELYIADLDAIERRGDNDRVIADVIALGAPVLVDAGVSAVRDAHRILALGSATVVIGLETLVSDEALDDICSAIGGHRVAVSLDLPRRSPEALAARAARANVGTVIVLDLPRVGASVGPDLDLVRRIGQAAPDVRLLAGGGVRHAGDLAALADAGCEGALVATALHDGRLDVLAVARASHFKAVR